MAITFTWSVNDLHRVADTGAVYKVDWSCSGVDKDTSTSHSRSGTYRHMSSVNVPALTEDIPEVTKVRGIGSGDETTTIVYPAHKEVIKEAHTEIVPATPDHTASGFTAYADLTEADVLAWCKAEGVEAETEAFIARKIATKISESTKSTGMPWVAE